MICFSYIYLLELKKKYDSLIVFDNSCDVIWMFLQSKQLDVDDSNIHFEQ